MDCIDDNACNTTDIPYCVDHNAHCNNNDVPYNNNDVSCFPYYITDRSYVNEKVTGNIDGIDRIDCLDEISLVSNNVTGTAEHINCQDRRTYIASNINTEVYYWRFAVTR